MIAWAASVVVSGGGRADCWKWDWLRKWMQLARLCSGCGAPVSTPAIRHTPKHKKGQRERLQAYYMLLLGLIKLEWCIKCILSAHILFYLLQLQNVSMHACVRNKCNSYLLCQIRILNTTQEMHHRAVLINQNWHLPSWASFKSKVISHL